MVTFNCYITEEVMQTEMSSTEKQEFLKLQVKLKDERLNNHAN